MVSRWFPGDLDLEFQLLLFGGKIQGWNLYSKNVLCSTFYWVAGVYWDVKISQYIFVGNRSADLLAAVPFERLALESCLVLDCGGYGQY